MFVPWAKKLIKPVNPMDTFNKQSGDYLGKQEKGIREQFSKMRTGLQARQGVAKESALESLARQRSLSAPGAGAAEMMKQKALAGIESQLAGQDAEIGAQEAAALTGIKETERARQAAAQESQATRAQQQKQFDETMRFSWAEMNENLRTNIANSAIAFKNAGLQSPKDWANLLGGGKKGKGILEAMYGTRAPGLTAGGDYNFFGNPLGQQFKSGA